MLLAIPIYCKLKPDMDNNVGHNNIMSEQVKDWDKEVLHRTLTLPEDAVYEKIMGMTREKLTSQDKSPYRWRIVNALAAVCWDDTSKNPAIVRKIRTIFQILKERDLLWLAEEQDNDGDTALHSACNSGNLQTARLLLEFFPSECKKALKTLNRKKRTPLFVALKKRRWETLQLLLSFCVRHEICSEFLGLDPDACKTTLMHEAMSNGLGFEFMKIFLPTIIKELGEEAAKSSLVIYDEASNSAWYYLAERGDPEAIQNVLATVKGFLPDINISGLYINSKQQTILHLAYRHNFKRVIELLKEDGLGLMDAEDVGRIKPYRRPHPIEPPKKRIKPSNSPIQEYVLGGHVSIHCSCLTIYKQLRLFTCFCL